MFAYCGNGPVNRIDSTGTRFRNNFATISSGGGGRLSDYVIYYYHPESDKNLKDPAQKNHSASDSSFVGVSSFDELTAAINSVPQGIDDVYIYMHSDAEKFSFYYAQYYSATNIEESINEIDISGDIYLFSCKGGRGKLASTLASETGCTVVAPVYKVSFGEGYARCGWWSYYTEKGIYGDCTWYSFYPNGSVEQFSYYIVGTR